MKAGRILVLAALVTGLTNGLAFGQQVLLNHPDVVNARSGAFVGGVGDGETFVPLPIGARSAGGATVMLQDSGTDGSAIVLHDPGAVVQGLPDVPDFPPNTLAVDLGFQYLQPVFNSRAVALSIPPAAQGGFPVMASAGDLSNDFGFVPQFGAAYSFGDLGFGLAASGKILTLRGDLHRTSASAAGMGDLTASATVNIASVNVFEVTKIFTKDNLKYLQHDCLEDCIFEASIGGRYAHVDQTYNANLASGANQASVAATQKYDGFGPTASLGCFKPITQKLGVFAFSRGSFLIGSNYRESQTSVAVAGSPASGGLKLTDSQTQIVPVGEFEIGLTYDIQAPKIQQALGAKAQPASLWLRVGAVTNIWGNVGLLSLSDGAQSFSDGALLLYGFNVLLGIQH